MFVNVIISELYLKKLLLEWTLQRHREKCFNLGDRNMIICSFVFQSSIKPDIYLFADNWPSDITFCTNF